MGNDTYSREKLSKEKTGSIRDLYNKCHDSTKCRRLANKYLKDKIISESQFTWLAGQGCLGQKLKWQYDEYNKLKQKRDEMYSFDRILL